MSGFKNIQKTQYEIKSALLNNADIRKLLYYDQPDALSLEAPTIEQVKEHITFFPINEMGIQNYDKNTLLSITCARIDTSVNEEDNGSLYVGYLITVVTTKNVWELSDYKIRLIELASLIRETLDGKKFSLPLPLEVLIIDDMILDGSRAGYIIKLDSGDYQKNVSL